MQGVFLHGSRPKSKKEIREVVEAAQSGEPSENGHQHDLYCVVIEATSVFGNEYDGSLANAPKLSSFHIVGPDPYKSRRFYGSIEWTEKKGWVVK